MKLKEYKLITGSGHVILENGKITVSDEMIYDQLYQITESCIGSTLYIDTPVILNIETEDNPYLIIEGKVKSGPTFSPLDWELTINEAYVIVGDDYYPFEISGDIIESVSSRIKREIEMRVIDF